MSLPRVPEELDGPVPGAPSGQEVYDWRQRHLAEIERYRGLGFLDMPVERTVLGRNATWVQNLIDGFNLKNVEEARAALAEGRTGATR